MSRTVRRSPAGLGIAVGEAAALGGVDASALAEEAG
jgi:hypothetical protein